jgi:hypothetical protein
MDAVSAAALAYILSDNNMLNRSVATTGWSRIRRVQLPDAVMKLLAVLVALSLIWLLAMLVGNARPVADADVEARFEKLPIPLPAPRLSEKPKAQPEEGSFPGMAGQDQTLQQNGLRRGDQVSANRP